MFETPLAGMTGRGRRWGGGGVPVMPHPAAVPEILVLIPAGQRAVNGRMGGFSRPDGAGHIGRCGPRPRPFRRSDEPRLTPERRK